MANSGIIHEFKAYIHKYIEDNQCYGFNSVTARIGFVPRPAIEHFWHRDRVINVLCAGPDRIQVDIDSICRDYLIVFSILVWEDRPKAITTFTEIGLGDHRIPVTSKPREWTDVPGNQSVWEDLQKANGDSAL
jgi:hypothetical protein